MTTFGRRVLLAGIAIGLAGPTTARTASAVPDPAPAEHHWPLTRGVLALRVIDRCGPLWHDAVRAAADIWNDAWPLVRFVVEEGELDGPRAAPGVIVIRSPNLDAGWNGITERTTSPNGTLRSVTITLDDANYTDRYPWPQESARGSVVGHELGHALGLTHSPAGSGGWMAVDRLQRNDPLGPGEWTLKQAEITYAATPTIMAKGKRTPKKRRKRH